MSSKITTINELESVLNGYIPHGFIYKYPGNVGILRTKAILKKLGDPQEKIKVIHVAGTSGKGSTCTFIANLLRVNGFRVGLHVTPHLIDIRERFQVNDTLVSKDLLIKYFNNVLKVVKEVEKSKLGRPTYFEITVALAYYVFYKEGVDYAVIETGLGGLLDGTNVVSNKDKVAIITRIGYDHTDILGKKLSEIAYQKTGIIGVNNNVITLKQHVSVLNTIKSVAMLKKANLYTLSKDINYTVIGKNQFNFKFKDVSINNITLGVKGDYQIENCALALSVVVLLSRRDEFSFELDSIRRCLASMSIIGRMAKINYLGKEMLLDGAHNPQKMDAFLSSLIKEYPNNKFNFLISFRKGKDYRKMIKLIMPLAEEISIVNFSENFQGLNINSEDPEKIKKLLNGYNYSKVRIFDSVKDALNHLTQSNGTINIVTGSFYLLSSVYRFIREK